MLTNSNLRSGSCHSGSASWDDCGWVFPDEFHVSLFPDRFQHRGGTDSEEELAHKVNSGEENSPAAPAGIRTCNRLITSPVLNQQAILASY